MSEALIGERVAEWRRRRGKSQRVLAGLAGISQGYLSKIESGDKPLDKRSTLVGLAAALQVSVAELTGQPGDPTDPPMAGTVAGVPAIRHALIARSAGAARATGIPSDQAAWTLRTLAAFDHAALAPRLPDLIADASGPDLVGVCYAAMRVLRDLGYIDLSLAAAELGLAAAREYSDPAWIGVAEYVRGAALPSEVSALAADLSASVAAEIQPEAADSSVRQALGMLHLRAALRHATAGHRSDARTHLDHARAEADTLGDPGADGGLCRLAFGPTNVRVWTVPIMIELGEPEAAVRAAAGTDPRRIAAAPNREAIHWLDYGRALAAIGRDGEAIMAILRAETVCPQYVRLRPTVRDTVAVIWNRTRRNAVSGPLRKAAEMVGLPT